jgi:hypothetical protein
MGDRKNSVQTSTSNKIQRTIDTDQSPYKRNQEPLTINITYTQYEIIHDVAQASNFRTTTEEEEDWDIWFIDGPVMPQFLTKMKPY